MSRSPLATSAVPPRASSNATAGGEEVVRLVAVHLRGGEAHRFDELRRQVELLEQVGVEHAPGLVRGERLVAVGRHRQRVPRDEHGARPLLLPEPDEQVADAVEQPGRTSVRRGGSTSAGRGTSGARTSRRRRSGAASRRTFELADRGHQALGRDLRRVLAAGEVVERDRRAVGHPELARGARAGRCRRSRPGRAARSRPARSARRRCAPAPRTSSAAPSCAACPPGT